MKFYSLDEKLNIRSTNINIFKFICAISVIISHSYAITSGSEDFLTVITRGQCSLGGVAVAVFFLLSGLYVSKSLQRTDNSFFKYMSKRCERIFPQLWLVVILSLAMGAVLTTLPIVQYFLNMETYKYLLNGLLIPIHNLPGVFEGLPYQTVNGPLWTLPVEFCAYIVLGLLAVFSKLFFKEEAKEKRVILDIIVFVLLTILLVIVYSVFGTEGIIFSALRPFVIYFEGVLFYDFRTKIKLNPLIGMGLLILTGGLIFTPFFNLALVILFPYGMISLVLGLPQIRADLKVFMISYEMYLVGWPIQQIVIYIFRGGMSPLSNWIVSVPIDIVLGSMLYFIVELITKRKVKKQI